MSNSAYGDDVTLYTKSYCFSMCGAELRRAEVDFVLRCVGVGEIREPTLRPKSIPRSLRVLCGMKKHVCLSSLKGIGTGCFVNICLQFDDIESPINPKDFWELVATI